MKGDLAVNLENERRVPESLKDSRTTQMRCSLREKAKQKEKSVAPGFRKDAFFQKSLSERLMTSFKENDEWESQSYKEMLQKGGELQNPSIYPNEDDVRCYNDV